MPRLLSLDTHLRKTRRINMGYELIFNFHEEIAKGEYNKEETKTKNVKIGTPLEDIPLDVVAGRIMSQLARRNILIVDVEIYEYTKKKLSFKETSDGILIKNKKFSFDDGVNLSCVDVPEEETNANPQVGQLVNNQQTLQQLLAALLAGNQNIISDMANTQKTITVQNTSGLSNIAPEPKVKYLRKEIFNPVTKEMTIDSAKRGMRFTVGKLYPIINERMAPGGIQAGMMYTAIDDNGKRQILSDKFFTPEIAKLENDFEEEFTPYAVSGSQSDGLDWGGELQAEPELNVR